MNQSESRSYQSMLTEVEKILATIASPDLELDELVVKVEGGYQLLRQMRERLKEVKGKVEQLQADNSETSST